MNITLLVMSKDTQNDRWTNVKREEKYEKHKKKRSQNRKRQKNERIFCPKNSNLFVYPKWDTDEWLMGSKCLNVTPSPVCVR